jgi:hypothetical protein
LGLQRYHTIFLWITHLSAIVAFGFFYMNALSRRSVLPLHIGHFRWRL